MSLLEVDGLVKEFARRRRSRHQPVRAVDDVSFSLAAGRTLAIVGESGAGKSTVARMVLRLIEPDRGSVVFDGVELRGLGAQELRRQRRRMQMIFQDPHTSLDPYFTIAQTLAEPLKIHLGMSRDERTARVEDLVDKVQLPATVLDRRPGQLSGGQLQRVSIARSLATSPDLLVCDEPVSALDYSIGAQIINLLLDLQQSDGLSVLFISHDLRLVRVIADDVMVMRGGRVVEHRPTEELFEDPRDPFTQQLLEAMPGGRRPGTPAVPPAGLTTASSLVATANEPTTGDTR